MYKRWGESHVVGSYDVDVDLLFTTESIGFGSYVFYCGRDRGLKYLGLPGGFDFNFEFLFLQFTLRITHRENNTREKK